MTRFIGDRRSWRPGRGRPASARGRFDGPATLISTRCRQRYGSTGLAECGPNRRTFTCDRASKWIGRQRNSHRQPDADAVKLPRPASRLSVTHYEKRWPALLFPVSALLGVQHAFDRRRVRLGALFRAFLFERLAGLLGHTLARRFVRHDWPLCSGAWMVPIFRPYAHRRQAGNAVVKATDGPCGAVACWGIGWW